MASILGWAPLFVGVPAALLVGATFYLMRVRRRNAVWPLHATAVPLVALLCVVLGAREAPALVTSLATGQLVALVTVALLLLPVPLILDVHGQPGVHLARRAWLALGAVLAVALVVSPILLFVVGCMLTGSCL
jgi:hypothetical protein